MTLDASVEWTYDPENLGVDSAAGRLAEARLHLGDTDNRRKLIGDAELTFFISQEGNNPRLGAARAAEALAIKFAGMGVRRIGDLTMDYTSVARGFAEAATSLRGSASKNFATPWAASHVTARKDSFEQDTGLVQPYFSVDMHENEGPLTVDGER